MFELTTNTNIKKMYNEIIEAKKEALLFLKLHSDVNEVKIIDEDGSVIFEKVKLVEKVKLDKINEDINKEEDKVSEEQVNIGVISILNNCIQQQWENIDYLNSLVATIVDEDKKNNTDIFSNIKDNINNCINNLTINIGLLEDSLKKVSQNTNTIIDTIEVETVEK